MSWIFLTGERVYKLKKAVRYHPLDYSSLDRRRHFCHEEVRLNRRFSDDIYLGVLPMRLDDGSGLSLSDTGRIVDYLVEMRQLPADRMLDHLIDVGRVRVDEIVAVADRLGRYYAATPPRIGAGEAYLTHLLDEIAAAEDVLMRPELGIASAHVRAVLTRVRTLLTRWTPAILERIAAGHIVEGHADLRPEHVCLLTPPQIFDCLDFDAGMRLIDPYDELNYLGLECEFLGAAWIRPILLAVLEEAIGSRPERRLIATYGAVRATLRARICLAHLLDEQPRDGPCWRDRARAYLALAESECARAL